MCSLGFPLGARRDPEPKRIGALTNIPDVLPAVVCGPRKFQYEAQSKAEIPACQKNCFGASLRRAPAVACWLGHAELSYLYPLPRELPQMLNLDCIVQRDPDVIAAEAGPDLVMVSITNGLYYGVSDVARELWRAIEHPKKISDLIDDLVATYNIDRSKCEEETLSFLEDLLTERLLQVKH